MHVKFISRENTPMVQMIISVRVFSLHPIKVCNTCISISSIMNSQAVVKVVVVVVPLAVGPTWLSVWLLIKGSWVWAALDPLGFFVGVSLGKTLQSPAYYWWNPGKTWIMWAVAVIWLKYCWKWRKTPFNQSINPLAVVVELEIIVAIVAK